MNKTSMQVIIIIVVLAVIVAGMLSLTTLFPRRTTEKTTFITTSPKGKYKSIRLIGEEVYAAEIKALANNTYYAKSSVKGDSYYLKLVFEITPPLKGNEYLALNISSNIGMFSVTLYSSRLLVDPKTGELCERNWYNIQVANMINKTVRKTPEKPPVHGLSVLLKGNRSTIEVLDLDHMEKFVLYNNLNKTIEVYGNETVERLKAGPERALAVYGEYSTIFITTPVGTLPPTVDRILIEIAYPKEWLTENIIPWLIVSFSYT